MKTVLYMTDTAFLEDAEAYRRLYLQADERRREQTARYRLDRDKRLSVGVNALLRYALRREGIAETPPVSYGTHGKPYFPDRPDLHFNLSHSGDMALCVLSGAPCGCDIQRTEDAEPRVADRFFAPEEKQRLAEAPEEMKKTVFCCLWTLKESYLKATGKGLSRPLNSFAVLPGETQAEALYGTEDGWRLYTYDPGNGYRCACCVADRGRPELIRVAPELL